MRKLLRWRPPITRSHYADALAACGGVSFTVAGFQWCPIAGLVVLGLAFMVAGWEVDHNGPVS
jgi:hypothetical protein